LEVGRMSFKRFWIREDGVEYDDARRRVAGQRAVIYYLVAFYIGYMGYSIMKNRLTGDDTMSYPLAITLASILFVGALSIILYATHRMRIEFEKSKLTDTKIEEKQD
jgi:dolichyl-phosphate-mannose--protein O-mannosyl transferase